MPSISRITDVFSFYRKLRTAERNTALLESLGDCDDGMSRYCIVGACPQEMLAVSHGKASVTNLATGTVSYPDNWLQLLDTWVPLNVEDPVTGPYQTGAIGYLGYDAKDEFECYAHQTPPDTAIPDVCLVRYGVVLVFDRKSGKSHWVADAGCEDRIAFYEALADKVEPDTCKEPFITRGDIEPHFDESQYEAAINRLIEYIRAGDIFQANYSVRFGGHYSGDVIDLYAELRRRTPNPFFALLDFPHPMISTSPERFLEVHGERIAAYPIKGTKRCVIDGVDQCESLRNSAKNRAENIMIADLMRNDLGRVCRQGSIDVEDLCRVRRFNQLYHLESVVSGTLRPGTTTSSILRAAFPGGSITGAPKIRAVEIIEELEFQRRGPYCGAIGFFGNRGWIDTSIAIRVIYFDADRLYFHTGGGIVADSEADDEYRELMLKAELIHATLESFNVMRDVRSRLDRVDDEIFSLIHQRFRLIQEASAIKHDYGVPVLQKSRMQQMIARRKRQLETLGGVPPTLAAELYEVLIGHAMSIESQHSA